MFKSAVYKLTLWYVAALAVVIVFFSGIFYLAGANRIERATTRQGEILRNSPGGPPANRFTPEINDRRQQILEQEQSQLMSQIILIDIILLLLGGMASYYFAKRTLRPIEESHQAQAEFTANASHQLRTPLAIMQTEIELALKNKSADKKLLATVLESNLEEVERLKSLSKQLLLLNQIDNQALQKEKVNLSKIVESQVQVFRKLTKNKIVVHSQPETFILGEQSLIHEVIGILIDNSIKYGDSGAITINLKAASGSAKFEITNSGDPISDYDIERIFERFHRGTQSEQNSGHGLGLSIARSIIEAHGGTISAESKQSKTTFRFNLPLA